MDKKPVKGLDITAVVKLITGVPNSRVELEIFRSRDALDIHPSPVIVAPFQRKEIVLKRKLDPPNTSVAGLGILFHKVFQALSFRRTHRSLKSFIRRRIMKVHCSTIKTM